MKINSSSKKYQYKLKSDDNIIVSNRKMIGSNKGTVWDSDILNELASWGTEELGLLAVQA